MTTEYTIGDLTRSEFLYMLGLVGVDDPKIAALAALSWGGSALKVLQVNATENGWQFAAVAASEPPIAVGTTAQYWRGDKSWQPLNKAAVGLGSADNTADATKVVLSASKLTTARNINGVAFDGTGNITIGATDPAYTAADALTKIKTVDGFGSGLDTDLINGATPSAYFLNLVAAPDLAATHVVLGLGTAAGKDIDTDGTLAANSDAKVASQKAAKTYIDGIIAAQDAMVFKAVIDCSGNPNYPAADKGHTYRVSVAGKIGGASGPNVEAGDILICLTDGTASGTHAAVGASWGIIQVNIDGAVIGPAAATDSGFVRFDGTTGKLIKNGAAAVALGTEVSGTLAATNGGTGQASYAVGDLLYASTTTALAKLADVATGNVLISGGVNIAPSWGKVSLTVHVSGILPGANGGTGNGFAAFAGPASTLKTFNLPNANETIACLGQAQTWTAAQTFSVLVTTDNVTIGAAAGLRIATLSGGAGTAEGGYVRFLKGGAAKTYIGDYSAINGTSTASGFTIYTVAGDVTIQAAGTLALTVSATAVSPVSTTTASAANVFQSGSGTALLRSTSSRRYKRDIENIDPAYADAVFQLRPVWYRSKADADNSDWSWWGLVAEEVAEIDPRLVHWNYPDSAYVKVRVKSLVKGERRYERRLKEGAKPTQAEAVQYERLTVLLLDVVKRQEARIVALERGADRSMGR